jgi:hypothetical protein
MKFEEAISMETSDSIDTVIEKSWLLRRATYRDSV